MTQLRICMESRNDQIRRNACYILQKMESNHWHQYWQCCMFDDFVKTCAGGLSSACLTTYDIHNHTFSMIKKYPGLSDLSNGFAILTEMSRGHHITCNRLLRDDTVLLMQSYLNEIYLTTNITTKHIDIIFYASSFLINISCPPMVLHTKDVINMGINMFESIGNIITLPNVQNNEYFLKTINNILGWIGNILHIHHYMEQYLMQLLKGNQGTLIISLLKFINDKCVKNRRNTLHIVYLMVNEYHFLRETSLNRQFKSNTKMLIDYGLFNEIKQFFIYLKKNNEFMKCCEIYIYETRIILDILFGIIKYGESSCQNLILCDKEIMTFISSALISTKKGQNIRVLKIINYIFSGEDHLIISKLLYWNDGSIISGICRLINNYQMMCHHMSINDRIRFPKLLQYLITIHDYIFGGLNTGTIESDYLKKKLKENDLVNSLRNNKFIDKDKVNERLLNSMTNNNHELTNTFAFYILCLFDLVSGDEYLYP